MKRGAGKTLKGLASETDPKLFAQENEGPPMEDEELDSENVPPSGEPMAIALKLLNSRDYSSQRLMDALKLKGYSSQTISECIARLQGWGYLNDREYGSRRLEILLKKLKSRFYIHEDLIQQGLPEGLVTEILEESYPEEIEIQIAGKFLEKRAKIKRKSQIWGLRLLQQAGFSENTIHRCFPE
jgi:regulatory protein